MEGFPTALCHCASAALESSRRNRILGSENLLLVIPLTLTPRWEREDPTTSFFNVRQLGQDVEVLQRGGVALDLGAGGDLF